MKSEEHIPGWVDALLERYCRPELYEAISGDLYELFIYDTEKFGRKRARRRYILNALVMLRHRRLRSFTPSKTQHTMDLFSNYLRISLRDMRNNRIFSAINLLGLVTAFSAFLVILQFVQYETSFDRFHKNGEQIYRVINDRYQNNQQVQVGPITYPTVGPTLFSDYPEVISYTRLALGPRSFLDMNDQLYLLEDYLMADERFLKVFDFPLLHGDQETALAEPASLVITESYAQRLVSSGQEPDDLIGTSVQVSNWSFPCTITGIARDLPDRSHFAFDVLFSYKTAIRLMGEGADKSWEWSDFYHYIVLDEYADPVPFQKKLDAFGERYFGNGEISGAVEKFYLQPLADIHLNNELQYEYARVTDGTFVRLMFFIGLLILVIAWINYINITTSRALQRAREMGVRKVLGALRGQLLIQVLTESFVMNMLALIVATGLVAVLQPFINQLVSLPLHLSLLALNLAGLPLAVWVLAGFVVAILITGIYPAWLVSRFTMTEVVKGKINRGGHMVQMRKALVVGQFAAALILISGCVAIYRQIDYMRSQDLGLELENNLVIHGPQMRSFDSTFIKDFEAFKETLATYSGIESVTATRHMLGDRLPKSFKMHSPADPDRNDLSSNWMAVDHEFIDQFDVKVVAGRAFSWRDHHLNGDDVNTVILNEAAVELFRFTSAEAAVGQTIEITGRGQPDFTIIGVVENFHQQSLKKSIEPLLLLPFYSNNQFILVKYEDGKEDQAVRLAKETFGKFYPGNYFDYYFLEEYFDRQYHEDERIGMLSAVFTGLAIMLAVSGLYGLVLITFLRKTKEIGIRKVLGADILSLLTHYGGGFLSLIGMAIFIGLPVSYWLTEWFLADYSYSRGVEPFVLLLAASALFSLCVLTILFQTRRIAGNNPVDSLRSE